MPRGTKADLNVPEQSQSKGWTPRKRLLTAFGGGVSDRVPVNTYELAGFDSADWYNRQPAYKRLMDRIRAETDCITNWNPAIRPVSGTAEATAASATSYLDHSLAESGAPVPVERKVERDGVRKRVIEIAHTPLGAVQRVVQTEEGVNTIWQVEHWCKNLDDVDRVLSIPFEPLRYDAADLARVRGELGDRGLVMASLSDPAYIAADLMSMENFLLWAFGEKDHFARTVDVIGERVAENLKSQLATCVVDAYRICGPEYFTPPYHRPSMFERFVVPHVKEMVGLIHEAGALARVHCHGKIGQVLDKIIATGCDGVDPCEAPPAGDITLGAVKERCHSAGVSVWGTMPLEMLEFASRGEIRRHVAACMEQAKAGGGYIFLPCAAPINRDLSAHTASNYMTMIDAALEFGVYE